MSQGAEVRPRGHRCRRSRGRLRRGHDGLSRHFHPRGLPRFDGDVLVRTLATTDWETLPVSAGYVGASRGFGVHDLASTAADQEPRAGGRLAFHVLDVMESLLRSAYEARAVAVQSRSERPHAVPLQNIIAEDS